MLKKVIEKMWFAHRIYRFLKKTPVYKNWAFRGEFNYFSSMQKKSKERFLLNWRDRYPILNEKTSTTSFDAHYIYHPAWAARNIEKIHPALHVDISSSLAFCTMLSAFIPVEFYDFRPAELSLEGLTSKRGNLMDLPFADNSLESLSCMHVVEHIGLGRYGDPLDPDGDLKAMAELSRVLAKGGSLFFVTPVGLPVIYFNAHRVYSYDQILSYFPDLQVKHFSLVNDQGQFISDADSQDANRQRYGCGCWWFTK